MSARVIGLTGGIGSGKSTIAEFFKVLGFPVYNSDISAKQVYFNPAVRAKVIALLGEGAYTADQLNKTYISQQIFNDKSRREQLNAIIHPAVKTDFERWLKEQTDKDYVVKETALLFETGIYKSCYKNILVTAPVEIRIERVMRRDQLTRAQVEQKIKSQMPEEEKAKLSDLILVNDNSNLLLPKILDWVKSTLI